MAGIFDSAGSAGAPQASIGGHPQERLADALATSQDASFAPSSPSVSTTDVFKGVSKGAEALASLLQSEPKPGMRGSAGLAKGQQARLPTINAPTNFKLTGPTRVAAPDGGPLPVPSTDPKILDLLKQLGMN